MSNLEANDVRVIDTATNTASVRSSLLNNTNRSLIDQVQALVAQGVLTQKEADKLIKKLEGAQTKFDKGQTRAVCGQLGSLTTETSIKTGLPDPFLMDFHLRLMKERLLRFISDYPASSCLTLVSDLIPTRRKVVRQFGNYAEGVR